MKYLAETAVFLDDDKTFIQVTMEEELQDAKGETFKNLHPAIIEITPSNELTELLEVITMDKIEQQTLDWKNEQVAEDETYTKRIINDVVKIVREDQPTAATFDPNNLTAEDLFKLKLQSFEIEQVKTSKNRELKAKIRKADSFMEVVAYTTATILDGQS